MAVNVLFGLQRRSNYDKNRSEAAQVAIVHDTLLKRKGELDDIRLRMQEIKDFLGRDLLDYLDKHDLDVPSLFPK